MPALTSTASSAPPTPTASSPPSTRSGPRPRRGGWTSSWAGTYQLNVAALQGFIAGLHNAGASGPIGIYSTSAQWHEITGLTAQTTKTAFNALLPDWVAGTKA